MLYLPLSSRRLLFSLFVAFVPLIAGLRAADYSVNFEGLGETKTAYGSGNVTLSGISWNMTDVLIGTSTSDYKEGFRSARLQGVATSVMTMLADKSGGIGTISFKYRRYGTDTQVEWAVEYSADQGATWAEAGRFTAGVDVATFSATLDEPTAGRIRIRSLTAGTSNRRVNVDDILITTAPGVAPGPILAGVSPAAAAAGTNVTISGENLANPTSVTFPSSGGPISGQVVSSSATEVVVTVPAGAQTGLVTVTTANGSATIAFRSLNPIPLPYELEGFETGFGAWFTYSVEGLADWTRVTFSNPTNSFLQINGFNSDVPANDWVILGPIEVPADATNLTAFFSIQKGFENNLGAGDSELEFRVSTNYSGVGDPSSATWQTVPFNKPATTQTSAFSSSGAVPLPSVLAGSNSVYVAFHYTPSGAGEGTAARWRVDNFEILSTALPLLEVTAPASLVEGTTANGTVTIPAALGSNLTVTVTSADATEITVSNGVTSGASTTVTIPAGSTSANFQISAVADGVIDANESVQIVAEATGYEFGQVLVQVLNNDYVLPTVVINKVLNDQAGDVVELLVVGDGTVGSTVDLRGMILKDYSSTGNSDGGGRYTFADTPLWQSVPAGTLVVLTKSSTAVQDVTVGDYVLRLNLDSATNFTANGTFNVAQVDMVQVKAAGSPLDGSTGAIHSFAVGSTTATQIAAAPLPKVVTAADGDYAVVTNANSTLADFNGSGISFPASLPQTGVASNPENAAFIASMRGTIVEDPPVIFGTLTISGQVGVAVSYQISATGSPTSYAADPLPAGLTLDPVTGVISGLPEAVAVDAAVPISATNASGTGTATLTFNIARGTPSIVTPPTAGDITEGQTLGDSLLTGGEASVPGQFSWTSSATTPPLGTASYSVTFTPTDTANYDSVTLQVSLNVLSGDYEFSDWSGGQPLTAALLEKFAIGGAASPSAVGETPVTAVEGSNLTITAIVRTNNSGLTVTAEATGNLAGSWSGTGVTSTTAGVSQVGVPDGTERRKFSVPVSGTRTFIRLRAVLVP